eukprot:2154385-Prorocentrum_lima.AAC.1
MVSHGERQHVVSTRGGSHKHKKHTHSPTHPASHPDNVARAPSERLLGNPWHTSRDAAGSTK